MASATVGVARYPVKAALHEVMYAEPREHAERGPEIDLAVTSGRFSPTSP